VWQGGRGAPRLQVQELVARRGAREAADVLHQNDQEAGRAQHRPDVGGPRARARRHRPARAPRPWRAGDGDGWGSSRALGSAAARAHHSAGVWLSSAMLSSLLLSSLRSSECPVPNAFALPLSCPALSDARTRQFSSCLTLHRAHFTPSTPSCRHRVCLTHALLPEQLSPRRPRQKPVARRTRRDAAR